MRKTYHDFGVNQKLVIKPYTLRFNYILLKLFLTPGEVGYKNQWRVTKFSYVGLFACVQG